MQTLPFYAKKDESITERAEKAGLPIGTIIGLLVLVAILVWVVIWVINVQRAWDSLGDLDRDAGDHGVCEIIL